MQSVLLKWRRVRVGLDLSAAVVFLQRDWVGVQRVQTTLTERNINSLVLRSGYRVQPPEYASTYSANFDTGFSFGFMGLFRTYVDRLDLIWLCMSARRGRGSSLHNNTATRLKVYNRRCTFVLNSGQWSECKYSPSRQYYKKESQQQSSADSLTNTFHVL